MEGKGNDTGKRGRIGKMEEMSRMVARSRFVST